MTGAKLVEVLTIALMGVIALVAGFETIMVWRRLRRSRRAN